jgi:hypothetical protein
MPDLMDSPVAKKKPKPAPEPTGRKPTIVQIRGGEAFKAWVEGLAGRDMDTVAKLFERAVRRYAKETGYPDGPKR